MFDYLAALRVLGPGAARANLRASVMRTEMLFIERFFPGKKVPVVDGRPDFRYQVMRILFFFSSPTFFFFIIILSFSSERAGDFSVGGMV